MPEAAAERTVAHPSRCANHPGVASAAVCSRCRRPLCIACAVPVRGSVFGPECLPEVLEDAPTLAEVPEPGVARARLLMLVGFGLATALSILPWSRFGDASGMLEAWRVHWSLLSVAAAAAGLVAVLALRVRPRDPRVEATICLPLALAALTGAILHRVHPPSLSVPSAFTLLAIGAASIALIGAGIDAWTALRAR